MEPMTADKIPTDTLLQKLLRTTSLKKFFHRYSESAYGFPSFSEHLSIICAEKETVPERVIKKSDIERTYGHQIFNGRKKPSRDKVIQLAFGFGMSFDETQRLLTLARKSTLHPKVKRDAVIIYALERDFGIKAVNDTLFELSIPLLGDEK
jgi:hypothetical protein